MKKEKKGEKRKTDKEGKKERFLNFNYQNKKKKSTRRMVLNGRNMEEQARCRKMAMSMLDILSTADAFRESAPLEQ